MTRARTLADLGSASLATDAELASEVATLNSAISGKADLASPTFTGDVTIPEMPYKMAAGYISAVSTSGTTITFPAGRFSVIPLLAFGPGYISGNGGTGDAIAWQYASVTATGATLVSSTASSYECHWIALQMTPSSAGG